MKEQDKIDVLNLIIKEIEEIGQHKLNVITFLDLKQLLKKAIDKLNKCTCLNPQSNCFSGKCSYCNRTIQKDITTDDL